MRHVDATREQYLKRVAGDDIVFDTLHVSEELLACIVRVPRRGLGCSGEIDRLQRRRLSDTRDRFGDLRFSLLVRGAQCRVVRPVVAFHADDDARLPAQIVDDHERASEDKKRVWNVGERGGACGRMGQALDVAHDVVPEEANRSAPEIAQLWNNDGRMATQARVEIGERIAWPADAVPATIRVPVLDGAVAKAPRAARRGAEKGVACPRLSTRGRALQQECERRLTQLRKDSDGRFSIEKIVAPNRHERTFAPGRRAMRKLAKCREGHESLL